MARFNFMYQTRLDLIGTLRAVLLVKLFVYNKKTKFVVQP